MKKYHTEYSFAKENEKEGFDFIINHIKGFPELSYKIKDNYHDLGDYKSIEISYYSIQNDDCECFECTDGFGDCDFNEGLTQAQIFEELIQKELSHIL